MLKLFRSLATKAKSKGRSTSPDTSPLTRDVPSCSPPGHRSRQPLDEEQEAQRLDEMIGHHISPDGGDISNTGEIRILENKTYAESRHHGQAPIIGVDTTEKEVVTYKPQPNRSTPAAVGLGISENSNARTFSEQDVRDGLHGRQYFDLEDRRRRLQEVEHQLSILKSRFDQQTTELEEEAQDLRSEVKRLQKIVWGS